ncbi:MAG: hypothetical protein E6H68_02735 [Betaproteobacteria bacterium]|nr:MAG: hypothetical protein E6H68_02735 [Betaproteobacteria bacterium]
MVKLGPVKDKCLDRMIFVGGSCVARWPNTLTTRQSVNQGLRAGKKASWIRIGYGGVEVIEAPKRGNSGQLKGS